MVEKPQHTNWEKLKILATAFSIIVTPIVIAWIGSEYNSGIKDREVQGNFVELAVSILNQEPNDDNKNIREWAVEIINKYSGVELKSEAKDDLINKVTLSQEYISSTKRIQIMLRELDYYNGVIDGVPGEETIKAIEDALANK